MRILLAEFAEPETMLAAARKVDHADCRLRDAFTPFPVEGMAELLGATSTKLRVLMFLGGMLFAAGAYATEGVSAVFLYPINSGGRPLNSWPAFMLFPFAVGIFGAALTGLIGLLVQTGLPALRHPLFSAEGFERSTQDRFFLALEPRAGAWEDGRARGWLCEVGAVAVTEIET